MLLYTYALVYRVLQPALGRVLQHHSRPKLGTLCMRTKATSHTQQNLQRPHTPRAEPQYRCPGCQRPIFKFESVQRHVEKCCWDLFDVPLTVETWEASSLAAAARQRAAQDAAVRTVQKSG